VALRGQSDQEQQASRFHQCHTGHDQDLREGPTPRRNQLPLRPQEAPVQEVGARPHQGDHAKSELQRHFPSSLYGRRGLAEASWHLQVTQNTSKPGSFGYFLLLYPCLN
jgi:hypothetical protein